MGYEWSAESAERRSRQPGVMSRKIVKCYDLQAALAEDPAECRAEHFLPIIIQSWSSSGAGPELTGPAVIIQNTNKNFRNQMDEESFQRERGRDGAPVDPADTLSWWTLKPRADQQAQGQVGTGVVMSTLISVHRLRIEIVL